MESIYSHMPNHANYFYSVSLVHKFVSLIWGDVNNKNCGRFIVGTLNVGQCKQREWNGTAEIVSKQILFPETQMQIAHHFIV